jgi:DNA mismatch repair protein MutS
LILDEIGRGTSTFDGMAVARAVLEWTANPKRLGARTLFATHYHELTALDGRLYGVRNYTFTVREHDGSVAFLRKLEPGAHNRSYGIQVARLAGLPRLVLKRAEAVLSALEQVNAAMDISGIEPMTVFEEDDVTYIQQELEDI